MKKTKVVTLKYLVDVEIEVPEDMDDDQVLFAVRLTGTPSEGYEDKVVVNDVTHDVPDIGDDPLFGDDED